MPKIAIVTSSARPGRQSLNVARWVQAEADGRNDTDYDIINISDFALPICSEATPPAMRRYGEEIRKRWSATIGRYDGFIFIVSEYSHAIPDALQNALDYLSAEFRHKAIGFVSYGSANRARSIEQVRSILSGLQVADVRDPVPLSLFTDFRADGDFAPTPSSRNKLHGLINELLPRARAMEEARSREPVSA